jgi:hypothetical protein
MRKTMFVCIMILTIASGASAQDARICRIPVNLERLASKAAEVVDVTMDSNMLQFAGHFLNKKKPDEAHVQKLLSNIRNLCVRSFQFDKDRQYTDEDAEALRSQLRTPVWSRIVGVRSKRGGDNVDVYLRTEQGVITGLTVIAAEPKELTFVHIDGVIDPEQLSELGGQFGIPKLEMPPKSSPAGKAESK